MSNVLQDLSNNLEGLIEKCKVIEASTDDDRMRQLDRVLDDFNNTMQNIPGIMDFNFINVYLKAQHALISEKADQEFLEGYKSLDGLESRCLKQLLQISYIEGKMKDKNLEQRKHWWIMAVNEN